MRVSRTRCGPRFASPILAGPLPLLASALGSIAPLTAAAAQAGATVLPPPPAVTLTPGVAAPAIAPAVAPAVSMLDRASAARAPRASAPGAARTWADRIILSGEYAHLGAGPLHRNAGLSKDASVGYDLHAAAPRVSSGPRLELGWLRAARPAATAQGATAGLSYGIAVPHTDERLTLRPGLAVLGGWSESQGGDWYYDWRGLAGTSFAGQTGTVERPHPVRSSAFGVGAALGAAFRLGAGTSVTGSVRPWHFSGTAAAPLARVTTLAGVGLSVRPGAWRHAGHAASSDAASVNAEVSP